MSITISVITVARNSAGTIYDTCVSVREQIWPTIEHILVDGASTDETVAIAQHIARPDIRILSEPDCGIYDAMNKGFRMAMGDVVGCLNADDMLAHPRVLNRIAKVFEDPTVDVCYGDLVYIDPLNINRIIRYWRSGVITERDFRMGLMPAHPTFYIRRMLLNKVGFFNQRLSSANDYEFTLRCLYKYKLRAVYIPEILVKMRMGGVSNRSVRGVIEQNWAIFKALRLNGMKPSLLYPAGKLVAKARQYLARSVFIVPLNI